MIRVSREHRAAVVVFAGGALTEEYVHVYNHGIHGITDNGTVRGVDEASSAGITYHFFSKRPGPKHTKNMYSWISYVP